MADQGDYDMSEAPTNPESGSSMSRMMMPGTGEHRPRDPLPERVGRYRVVGQLGQGGMGVVLKATYEPREGDPPGTGHGRKQVAIKLIRRGTGTAFEDVLRRFEVECRVLGALNHPNIARFIEAGQTPEGDPYFVMEYVEGQAVTDYCDANNLSVRDRLEVFRKVCSAVQYAHGNMIVHRDIKPANIMVTPEGEPKLLDFGIAKILNPDMAVAVAITGPMMRLMTPEYASPEQVSGRPVNAMSDVYSLGVLLYELLSGQRPYRLATRMEHEIVRVICETDPERPSTAFTRVAKQRPPGGTAPQRDASRNNKDPNDPDHIAKHRSARPETLRRQLSGDLDDIVLMAMSKSPAQRFETVKHLADDVERHLRGEPVRARRARRRALYVARKFATRHRTPLAVAAASLVLLATLGGFALSESIARRTAESRADAIGDTVGMLFDIAGNRRLDVGLPTPQRVAFWEEIVTAMDAATRGIDDLSPDAAPVRLARAREEFGDSLGESATGGLGAADRALEQYRQAAETYDRAIAAGYDDEEFVYRTAMLRRKIGNLYGDMNRSADELEQLDLAVATFEKLDEEGDYAGKRRAGIAAALMDEGQVRLLRCETDEAIELLERSLAIREQMRRDYRDDPRAGPVATRFVFMCQGNLSDAYRQAGRLDDAKRLAESSLALRRQLAAGGEPDERELFDLAVGRKRLAEILLAQGRADAAIASLAEAGDAVRALVERDPKDAALRALRCAVDAGSVRAHLAAGNADEALRLADELSAFCDASEAELPENPQNREHRALAHLMAGKARLAAGAGPAARAALTDAWEAYQGLAAEDDTNAAHRIRLAETAIAAGDAAQLDGAERDTAAGWYADAEAIYDALDAENKRCGVDDETRASLREKLRG